MKQGRTVLEAKRYGVVSCSIRTTLLDAAKRMVEEDISALVGVDDDGCLAGVLSRTDLLRAHLGLGDWADQPVEKHMSRQVVTVTTGDTLCVVARMLIDRHIHRVVVVSHENDRLRPVAVVSDADRVYHTVKQA